MSSEADNLAILDHVTLGVFVLRDSFKVQFWNRYLESWTGIPREEILGKHIGTYFPELSTGDCEARFRDVFEHGLPTAFSSDEHRHLIPAPLPSGQLRIEYTTVTPLPREDGEAWDALVAVQDVTHFSRALRDSQMVRNRALDDLKRHRRASEQMAEEEEMFRTMAHRAPVMMWVRAPLWNQQVERGSCRRFGHCDVPGGQGVDVH